MKITFMMADGTARTITAPVYAWSKGEIVLDTQYIAMKLWQVDDIKSSLEEMGYKPNEWNVDSVINTHELDALNDCTDYDWEVISQAINDAKELIPKRSVMS